MIGFYFLDEAPDAGGHANGGDAPPDLRGPCAASDGWHPLGATAWVAQAPDRRQVEYWVLEALAGCGWEDRWRTDGQVTYPVVVVGMSASWHGSFHTWWPSVAAVLGISTTDVVFVLPEGTPRSSNPSGLVHWITHALDPSLAGLRRATAAAMRATPKVTFLDDEGDVWREWLKARAEVLHSQERRRAMGSRLFTAFHCPPSLDIGGLRDIVGGICHPDDILLLDHKLGEADGTDRSARIAEEVAQILGRGRGRLQFLTSTGVDLHHRIDGRVQDMRCYVPTPCRKPTDVGQVRTFLESDFSATLQAVDRPQFSEVEMRNLVAFHGLDERRVSDAADRASRLLARADEVRPLIVRLLGGRMSKVDMVKWGQARFGVVGGYASPEATAKVAVVTPSWWDDEDPVLALDGGWRSAKFLNCGWNCQLADTRYVEATCAYVHLLNLCCPRDPTGALVWGRPSWVKEAPRMASQWAQGIEAWRAGAGSVHPLTAVGDKVANWLGVAQGDSAARSGVLMVAQAMVALGRLASNHRYSEGEGDSFEELIDLKSPGYKAMAAFWLAGASRLGNVLGSITTFAPAATWYKTGKGLSALSPNDLMRLWILAQLDLRP